MHILMVSDVYFPRINGVSTSIDTFRRDLMALGIRVSLVVPDYPGHDNSNDDADIHRIPAKAVPLDPEDRLMNWGKLKAKMASIAAEGVDLIHIQTPFLAHMVGSRIAKAKNLPVVATYHTHFEEYIGHYFPILPKAFMRGIARSIARRQCNDLSAVIVPSQAMADTLSNYGVTVAQHALPTGIPLERFAKHDGPAFRAKYNIDAERKVGLYVGRAAHEKNIDFLIDATAHVVQKCPEFLLLIAGEGPALTHLKAKVKRMALENHVQFLGYLDRQTELPCCYAAADVFTFASTTETQGLVLLEALAVGTPVYAFAAMGTCDIVLPGKGAVAASQSCISFAQGLAELLVDPVYLAELSQDAKQFAARWSAPERANQLSYLYQSLTSRKEQQ